MNVKDDNMMLNPKDYRREFEAASLKKVLQERDRIVQFMQDYENHKLAKKYYERDPSPRVIYFIKEGSFLTTSRSRTRISTTDILNGRSTVKASFFKLAIPYKQYFGLARLIQH